MAEKTIRDLREELVKLGFSATAAKAIMSRKAANEVIKNLKSLKKAKKAEKVEPKKVETIADDSTPEENKFTEKRWRSKAERMAKHLEKQETIRVLIPLEANEKVGVVKEKIVHGIKIFEHVSGAIWSKTFNGYTVIYPKGTYVDVPEQIADNIREEYSQTEAAGRHLRLDRTDPRTGTSVRQQLQ